MRYTRVMIGLAALWLVAGLGARIFAAAKKKNPDDITQTLALPKDPPAVAVGETKRLMFSVSPLSGKGLLTQQTRDALRAILKENGGVPVVHIRAFVAGSGDVRRVPQIVSEVFTEKKLPLPSVSVIRAGSLPVANAQVILEAVSIARRELNANGVQFVAGDEIVGKESGAPVKPLLDKALTGLASKVSGAPALQLTCFVSDLNHAAELNSLIAGRFPGAAVDVLQTLRSPWQSFADCEAIAGGVVHGDRPQALKLAFTGTRVAFGAEEKDGALAFQRLDKDLAEAGATPSDIVLTNIYPLSSQVAKLVQQLRPSAGAITMVLFEGLASMDAGFAVDAVAGVSR